MGHDPPQRTQRTVISFRDVMISGPFSQSEDGELQIEGVLEGEADILVDTPKGAVKVATLGRNDIVGEIAILCDVPRTATVIASRNLETLKVSKDNFFQLVTQFPQIGVEVMHELASRLHHTTKELATAQEQLRELEQAAGDSGG